jgi:hypothetical protein
MFRNLKKTNLKLVAVISLLIIAIATAGGTLATLTVNSNVGSSGAVNVSANLGVYSDSGCTTPLTTINWGNLSAGGSITRTVYIKNTSSGLSLTLSMSTSSWNPTSANGPITVTWDKENTKITPTQYIAAVVTLNVSSSIVDITNFSVQINITGTN